MATSSDSNTSTPVRSSSWACWRSSSVVSTESPAACIALTGELSVEPGAGIEGLEFRTCQVRHEPGSVRRPRDRAVVHQDDMAVAGQLDVDLGHGGTGAPGKLQRRQRVLWRHSREPAMGRDQRPAGAPGEQLHQTFPNPAARYSCFNVRSATNIRMMVGTSRTIVTTAA